MTFMFEVYCGPDTDAERQQWMTEEVAKFGGWFDCREEPTEYVRGVVLTYEFNDEESASNAANYLRTQGYHVEGPGTYSWP